MSILIKCTYCHLSGNYNSYDEYLNPFTSVNVGHQNRIPDNFYKTNIPLEEFDPLPLTVSLKNQPKYNKNVERNINENLDRRFVGIGEIKNNLRLIKSVESLNENQDKQANYIRNNHWITFQNDNKRSSLHINPKSNRVQGTFKISNNWDNHSGIDKNTPCLAISHKTFLHNHVPSHNMEYDNLNSPNIVEYLTPKFKDSFWKNIENNNNLNNLNDNPNSNYLEYRVPSKHFNSRGYFSNSLPYSALDLNACLYKDQINPNTFNKLQNSQENLYYGNQYVTTDYVKEYDQNQYPINKIFNGDIDYDTYNNQNLHDSAIYSNIYNTNDRFINQPKLICPKLAKNTKHSVNQYINFVFNKPILNTILKKYLLSESELQILEHYRSITNQIIENPKLILKHQNILLTMLNYLQQANLKVRFKNAYQYVFNIQKNERSFTKNELEAIRLLGLLENYFRFAKEKIYKLLKNNEHLRGKDFNLYVTLILNLLPDLELIKKTENDKRFKIKVSEEPSFMWPYFVFLIEIENNAAVEVKLNKLNYMIDLQIFCGMIINENYNNTNEDIFTNIIALSSQGVVGSQPNEELDNYDFNNDINGFETKGSESKSEEYFYYNDKDDLHGVKLYVKDVNLLSNKETSKHKNIQEFPTSTTGLMQFTPVINLANEMVDKSTSGINTNDYSYPTHLSSNSQNVNKDKQSSKTPNGNVVPLKQIFSSKIDRKDSPNLSYEQLKFPEKEKVMNSKSIPKKDENKVLQENKDTINIPKTTWSISKRQDLEILTSEKPFSQKLNSNIKEIKRLNKLKLYNKFSVPNLHAINQVIKNRQVPKPIYKIKTYDYNRYPETKYGNFITYVIDDPNQSHPDYKYKPGFDTDLTLKSNKYLYNFAILPNRGINSYRNILKYDSFKKPNEFENLIAEEPYFFKQDFDEIHSNNLKTPWGSETPPQDKHDFIVNNPFIYQHFERNGLNGGPIPLFNNKHYQKNYVNLRIEDNKHSLPDLVRDSEYNNNINDNKPFFLKTTNGLNPFLVKNNHIPPLMHESDNFNREFLFPVPSEKYAGESELYNKNSPVGNVDNILITPDLNFPSLANGLTIDPTSNLDNHNQNILLSKLNPF